MSEKRGRREREDPKVQSISGQGATLEETRRARATCECPGVQELNQQYTTLN